MPSSVSVGTPKCSVRVYNWPEPQGLSHLGSLRAALWGLGSGEIRAMYLCGPSVLACWAGKAVLILILHPLYFWGRRGMSTHCCTMPKLYAVVMASSLRTAMGSYSCAVRFPGAPWGPAQLLSSSGRYVFAWWLLRASPSVLLAPLQRQSGCLGHGIWGPGTADHETSTDNSGHPIAHLFLATANGEHMLRAACWLF